MKKILITSLIFCAVMFGLKAEASVAMDMAATTYVTSNNIERAFLMRSDDGANYEVSIKPLDECVTNTTTGDEISLEKLYINNNREDVYFRFNEFSKIYDSSMGSMPRNMNAKIKNAGIVPAGDYSINFQVEATNMDTGVVENSSFNLIFRVGTLHELNTYGDQPLIEVSANDVFSTNKITNTTSPMVYITSNTDWILLLDGTDFDEAAGDYYVRVESVSSRVTNSLQTQARINSNEPIVLARGNAPADNESVTLEFSVARPNGEFIPAGTYTNRIRYILREGDN